MLQLKTHIPWPSGPLCVRMDASTRLDFSQVKDFKSKLKEAFDMVCHFFSVKEWASLKCATTPNHPQSSPTTQNIVTTTPNNPQPPTILSQPHPKFPHNHRQSPEKWPYRRNATTSQKIIQLPKSYQNIIKNSKNHYHLQ